jgi:hypothetical protein
MPSSKIWTIYSIFVTMHYTSSILKAFVSVVYSPFIFSCPDSTQCHILNVFSCSTEQVDSSGNDPVL